MDKTEQHKKAMLEALEKSLGVVTTACKSVGIGRTTHYMWLDEDPEYRRDVETSQRAVYTNKLKTATLHRLYSF
jgi:hypothetical protein